MDDESGPIVGWISKVAKSSRTGEVGHTPCQVDWSSRTMEQIGVWEVGNVNSSLDWTSVERVDLGGGVVVFWSSMISTSVSICQKTQHGGIHVEVVT